MQKASVQLESGDILEVVISNESGNVDVSVGIDGAEPVYTGNGLTDFRFSLNILESGIYQITVTGHNACGSVSFIKAERQQN